MWAWLFAEASDLLQPAVMPAPLLTVSRWLAGCKAAFAAAHFACQRRIRAALPDTSPLPPRMLCLHAHVAVDVTGGASQDAQDMHMSTVCLRITGDSKRPSVMREVPDTGPSSSLQDAVMLWSPPARIRTSVETVVDHCRRRAQQSAWLHADSTRLM